MPSLSAHNLQCIKIGQDFMLTHGSIKNDLDVNTWARPEFLDFVPPVRKVAGSDDLLMVMCCLGGRSALAVNLLAQGCRGPTRSAWWRRAAPGTGRCHP